MIKELIAAFLLVFIAEMGDKTQILAMMFASKYPPKTVLLGVFLGALANHGIAVLVGALLGDIIPVVFLSIIAGAAFIYFAFSSLKVEEESEEEVKSLKSAVMTVGMAFFIGELGDKTQLSAITLAMDALYPIVILIGTVTAMVATSILGIVVGNKIGTKISKEMITIGSSIMFFLFGITKLISTLYSVIGIGYILIGSIFVIGIFLWYMKKTVLVKKD